MRSLREAKESVCAMAEAALQMWRTAHAAFIEHDPDLIAAALEREEQLNRQEKELNAAFADLGRRPAQTGEKAEALAYAAIVGDLELIGDYTKDILERVQIKIEEKLLFSDEAVREYEDLYRMTEEAVAAVAAALARNDTQAVAALAAAPAHLDRLVDECRQRHTQRLIDGTCSPLAGNMYLNMLDLTAAVYYHAKKIARRLTGIKQ